MGIIGDVLDDAVDPFSSVWRSDWSEGWTSLVPMALGGKVFGLLGEKGISIRAIAQGSSELNISFVVRREDAQDAVRAIHAAFFPAESGARPAATSAPATEAPAPRSGPLDVVELATELI